MSTNMSCRCGKLAGEIQNLSSDHGRYIVCHCDDCQAFGSAIDADDVLDSHGGSHIIQMTQNRVRISKGKEYLECLRLRPKGLLRWYASCCHTPVANTISGQMPFVGLYKVMISDAPVGPVKYRVQAAHAKNLPPSTKAHPKFPLGLVLKIVANMGWGKLTGKNKPSPFFNDAGIPAARARIVNES